MNLSRRNLLLGAVQGAGLLLLSGCEKAFNSLQQNKKFLSLLESAEGANQRLQRFSPVRTNSPKNSPSKISPAISSLKAIRRRLPWTTRRMPRIIGRPGDWKSPAR